MRLLHSQTGLKSTITLFLDNSQRSELKAAFCLGCGKVLFQYYNDIHMAIPGSGPIETTNPVVVIQCRNSECKMLYEIFR